MNQMTTSTLNVKPVQANSKMDYSGLQPGGKLPKKKSRQRKYPPLTKAQQKLVEEHMWIAGRLAHSARRLTGGFTGCYTKDDLEGVAFLALCVASTRFDPDLGWKFSTFAWSTARGWIQHALRDHSRLVKVPRWIPGIREEVRELAKQGMTYAEIGDELGLDEKQVALCEESWQEIHSSYDHTPDDYRPREFTYEIDEVKAMFGLDLLKQVGDLSDSEIKLLLMHVEGLLETNEEKEKAEGLLDQIRQVIDINH